MRVSKFKEIIPCKKHNLGKLSRISHKTEEINQIGCLNNNIITITELIWHHNR